MIIQTGELREQDRRYTGEEPVSILELEHDPMIRDGSPVRYDLHAQRLMDDMLVRGTLAVEFTSPCSRCGEWFRKSLRVSTFFRSYPLAHENESIDLTGDIREDILLALPINLVCSAECRGVCPQCGVNLNKQSCGCHPGKSPAAWSVLDQLKLT